MDFIERLFGIAPDGASGALELLLLAMPVLSLVAWAISRRSRLSFAKTESDVRRVATNPANTFPRLDASPAVQRRDLSRRDHG